MSILAGLLAAIALCPTATAGLPAHCEPGIVAEMTAANSVAQADAKSLLARIKKEKDKTPRKVYEQLGELKNAAGLGALCNGAKSLTSYQALYRLCRAMRHFNGVAGVEEKAVDWLAAELRSKEQSRRNSAQHGLRAFGTLGLKPLEKAARSSKFEDLRWQAVGALLPVLRQRGDDDSLQLIFEAFRIPTSAKREVLVAALAGFDHKYLGRVLRKNLEDREIAIPLRTAAIEGLAKVQSKGVADAIVGALSSREQAIIIAAVHALRERQYAEHGGELRTLAKSRNLAERYAAFLGLASMPSENTNGIWIARIVAGSVAEDLEERLQSVASLQELATPAAVDALHVMLCAEGKPLRDQSLRAILSLRQRASIALMIERLAVEEDAHLKSLLFSSLKLMTGVDNGKSAARWGTWWKIEGAGFSMPTAELALEADKSRRRDAWERKERYSFYGLQIDSELACFVLDASGSMNAKNEIDITRLQIAKRQLKSALTRFPDGALFNVIFFGTSVNPIGDGMMKMDERMRKRALKQVETLGTMGRTALYDALRVAFDHEEADTIYLLSDGAPSGGEVTNVNEIRKLVAKWNAKRKPKITIHCVAVGGGHRLLRWLAEDSGGKYIEAPEE